MEIDCYCCAIHIEHVHAGCNKSSSNECLQRSGELHVVYYCQIPRLKFNGPSISFQRYSWSGANSKPFSHFFDR